MSNVVNSVTTQVGNFVNNVASDINLVVTTAIENPIPIIETIAVAIVLGPEYLDLGLSNVATSAISSAAVAAMNGASPENIAKSAAVAATGTYVSTEVAGALGAPPAPGTPPVPETPPAPGAPPAPPAPPTPPVPSSTTALLANIAGSAAGGAAATLVAGGNPNQIVQNALAGSLGAGTSAAAQYAGASPTVANTLAGYVSGSQQAGGNVLTGLEGATAALAKPVPLSTPTPTPTPTPTASADYAGQIASLNQQLYNASNVAFAGPGLGPEATQTVTDLTNQVLSKLQAAALNPATSPEELQTLAQSASRFIDPTVFGRAVGAIGLLLTPSTAGDPTEQAQVDAKYKALSDISQQVSGTAPLLPLTSVTLPPAPVVTPVTADVANVATALNISTDEALQLQQTNPNLFKNISGTGDQPAFVPANPETMRSTDLVINPTTGANDNIILASGKTPTATLQSPVTTAATQTAAVTPENQLVMTTDPASQTALVITPSGQITVVSTANQTVQPGQTVLVDPTTNTITSTQTSQTIQAQPVTTAQTGTTTATQPSTSSETTVSKQTFPTSSTSPQVSGQTAISSLTSPTTISSISPTGEFATPTSPVGPNAPTDLTRPPTPKTPSVPLQPSGEPFPTATTTSPITPSAVSTLLGTPTPGQTQDTLVTPTGPSTEKTPYPTFKPDVFVESNVPKTLAGALNIGGNLPLAGQTVGLGGGGGGVSVESGQEQKPIWNVASLKLKDEAEGTPDYGALSSALGI
jgi:hypothetical protein